MLIKSDGSVYNYQLTMEDTSVDDDIERGNFRVRSNSATDTLTRIDTTTQLAQDTWYFLTGTYDGNQSTIYLNGAAETSEAFDGDIVPADVPLLLGRRALGDERYFVGMIDEVRVESVARSAAWVAFQYDVGLDRVLSYGSIENNPAAP